MGCLVLVMMMGVFVLGDNDGVFFPGDKDGMFVLGDNDVVFVVGDDDGVFVVGDNDGVFVVGDVPSAVLSQRRHGRPERIHRGPPRIRTTSRCVCSARQSVHRRPRLSYQWCCRRWPVGKKGVGMRDMGRRGLAVTAAHSLL